MLSKISYPWFFFYRVARLALLVFLPTLFLILFLYRSSYREGLISQMSLQIEENLKTLNGTLKTAGVDWVTWCVKYPHQETVRYSLIKKDGTLLCDTHPDKDGTKASEHTEVLAALETGFDTNVRFAEAFETQAVFAALKLDEETAVRQVVPITSLRDDLNRFDRVLFLRIVPFALLSYLAFLLLFHRATKPLGSILGKVNKFRSDLPFDKNLQLLYKKNEWAEIEEALNEADSQLQTQVIKVRTENEKIAAILESISEDIIAVDPFETVLFYNSNFKKNFMRERKSMELMPKIWHTFKEENVLKAFQRVLKHGEAQFLPALNFPTSNRPDRYFDLTVTAVKNGDGKITGALGVFYDVTEFKLTEQMRVDFVANVSHEIRTPLTSIKGFSQVLEAQKAKVDPSLHGFLEKIVTNTERMMGLFNDLLNLSVIESKNNLKTERLNLEDLVEEVTSNIRANYPQKSIRFEKDLQLKAIPGDQRLMEQVLSNLIDNACKYGGDSAAVKLSSFAKDQKAYIVVTDNGPGIAKEHLNRIFERFYRVDSSREVSRGTGLGLSIAKHIIAKHGGRIWAESEEARGTTFIIELPA